MWKLNWKSSKIFENPLKNLENSLKNLEKKISEADIRYIYFLLQTYLFNIYCMRQLLHIWGKIVILIQFCGRGRPGIAAFFFLAVLQPDGHSGGLQRRLGHHLLLQKAERAPARPHPTRHGVAQLECEHGWWEYPFSHYLVSFGGWRRWILF